MKTTQDQPEENPDNDTGYDIDKLSKELKAAAKELNEDEVRYLVDRYYQIQHHRITANNQKKALDKKMDTGPKEHPLIDKFAENAMRLEAYVPAIMHVYAQSKVMGRWLMGVYGIGPIIASGLLAHIDIRKAPTVGHIWAFAGLDPTKKWLPKTRRPWNAELRTICWKAGQSFMKFSGREKCYYGKLYLERKEYETRNNLKGELSAQASAKAKYLESISKTSSEGYNWYVGGLTAKDWEDYFASKTQEKETFASKRAKHNKDNGINGTPMLPPAHIDARARRWTVKLFLAHLHGEWYKFHYKTDPPKPYAIEHEGHVHMIEPENKIENYENK